MCNFKFFQNKECEYFPCHAEVEEINCLFCFCPLYHMDDCGGNYMILERQDGTKIKDCSICNIPHTKNGYDYIVNKLKLSSRGNKNENEVT